MNIPTHLSQKPVRCGTYCKTTPSETALPPHQRPSLIGGSSLSLGDVLRGARIVPRNDHGEQSGTADPLLLDRGGIGALHQDNGSWTARTPGNDKAVGTAGRTANSPIRGRLRQLVLMPESRLRQTAEAAVPPQAEVWHTVFRQTKMAAGHLAPLGR